MLLQGIVVGFSIAAPVGPIGVLCIQRTLNQGWRAGLLSGLGAATADAIYGCIAAFGLGLAANLLEGVDRWLGLVGGAFLCYLGTRHLLARPEAEEHQEVQGANASGLRGAYLTTLVLTLTNPMTVLFFAGVLAGLAPGDGSTSGLVLVLGVFMGSALWWILLSTAASLLRRRFNPAALRWVNLASGMVILGFGLVILARGVGTFL